MTPLPRLAGRRHLEQRGPDNPENPGDLEKPKVRRALRVQLKVLFPQVRMTLPSTGCTQL